MALQQFHELRAGEELTLLALFSTAEEDGEEAFQFRELVVVGIHLLHLALFLLSEKETLAAFDLGEELGVELVVVNAIDIDDVVGFEDKEAARARCSFLVKLPSISFSAFCNPCSATGYRGQCYLIVPKTRQKDMTGQGNSC